MLLCQASAYLKVLDKSSKEIFKKHKRCRRYSYRVVGENLKI